MTKLTMPEPTAWKYDWYTAAGESDNGDEVVGWLSTDYEESHSPTMGCHNIQPLYTADALRDVLEQAAQQAFSWNTAITDQIAQDIRGMMEGVK